MKMYYIQRNGQSDGPYSIDELKSKGLQPNDFVWTEGTEKWIQAKYVSELQHIFGAASAPPPFQDQGYDDYYAPQSRRKSTSVWKIFRWSAIVILLGYLGLAAYSNRSENQAGMSTLPIVQKTPEQLREELAERERQNPGDYLVSRTSMRENLIGQKVFEGQVSNRASVAVFKDVVLEVSYLSKTNSVISTERFTVYEILKPKDIKSYKFKSFAPKGTADFEVAIVDGTPVVY